MPYRGSVPTVSRLQRELGITEDVARTIRDIITERIVLENEPDMFPQTWRWISQCFSRPRVTEIKLSMIGELLPRSYGFEHMDDPPCYYINRGDSYAATILYYEGNYIVGSWGDLVENNTDEDTDEDEPKSYKTCEFSAELY